MEPIPEDLAKAKSCFLPQKFVGHFDLGLNKMVWRCLKEDEVINLEKDPIHDTYFPRVEVGARRNVGQDTEHSQPHSGLPSGTASKSFSKLKVPESTVQEGKVEIVSRGKDGLGQSSKKGTRTTQLSRISIELTNEANSEKKRVAWEHEDTVNNAKKGRKNQVSPINVPRAKAEVAGQPRPQQ